MGGERERRIEDQAAEPAREVSATASTPAGTPAVAFPFAAGNAAVARLFRRASGAEAVAPDFTDRLADAGAGRPIPEGVRTTVEGTVGAPLDDVRLHTDDTADTLSRQAGALAFTTGRDVFFRSGAYQPDSATGLHLLAHEAAHTAQQLNGSVAGKAVAPGVFVGEPHAAEERQADAVAEQVVAASRDPQAAAPAAGAPRFGGCPSAGGGAVRIQRFAGPEHRDIGDFTMTEIDLGNGMILSWGEVLAIAGDEVGTPEEIVKDAQTPDGRVRIRAAMENAGLVPQSVPDAAKADQEKRYRLLAMENVAHFAAGGTAIDTWTGYHTQALQQALAAGRAGDDAAWQIAQLTEAFGEHFLTDAFSGGHIRTPRAEIISWYTGEFAPRVAPVFLRQVRDRLVELITAEISPQTSWPDFIVAGKVETRVDAILAEKMAPIGGPEGFTHWFGLGIAGAVSGAMHDLEGACGVRVSSESHPQPWQAYGDGSLASPPAGGEADVAISRGEVQLAVLEAQAQLARAHEIGAHSYRATSPATQPQALYFGFDKSALNSAGTVAVADAAEHLRTHPESVVHVVGNTDPVGSDAYNDALGQRRAATVAQALGQAGVAVDQVVEVRSDGEHNPVAVDPPGYPKDRRVDLHWDQRPGPWRDIAREEAEAQLAQALPPPYQDVLKFVPHPTPDGNVDVENWRWGQMPLEFSVRVNEWMSHAVTPDAVAKALGEIDETMNVEGYTIHPRAAVRRILDDLLNSPMSFCNIYFGVRSTG